ncbi:helix-turn-helix domain-containing protein [Bradyrhizobium sp. HKCCYLR1023]|uniref:helix-turn-helix domain-containing protein n=1 Tax=Bradyrhizobium TaxID=374 RepID=UPI003EB6E8DD
MLHRPARARSATAIDNQVGANIRLRRMALGMSQSALADKLGITFQQVQKYEKGNNRVTIGRLAQIAAALQVSAGFFLAGTPLDLSGETRASDVEQMLASPVGAELALALASIQSPVRRRMLIDIARTLASEERAS